MIKGAGFEAYYRDLISLIIFAIILVAIGTIRTRKLKAI
jgi:hypothetical protein